MKINAINQLIKLILLCSLLALQSYAQAEIKVTYYVPDAAGSPIAATDEQGDVLWRKHYKPFGEEIEQDAASKDNHVGYTGHVHDRSTGLTYMGARYYDSVVGRFMAMDSVGVDAEDPRTFNRYAYGNNNPYKFVDPDGRAAQLLLWGVGALLTVGDMANNDPVPGHEQDGIAPVITVPGPLRLGGKVAAEATEQGTKIVTRTTRQGDPGVRITKGDGSVIDITGKRVKEFIPELRAKKGLKPKKFDDALPGTKGLKREPTGNERKLLNDFTKGGS